MSRLEGHQARKRFGQNFLQDPQVIENIIAAIGPRPKDNLVEIGPGLGALTRELLRHSGQLHVVELDRDLIPQLKQTLARIGTLHIHQADALRFDFSSLTGEGSGLRVVGNLPYNISTPLLFHLFGYSHLISDMHFMLQKEVVQRMAAVPGTKRWGRLSVMVQYHCDVEMLFEVGPDAFNPAPKVDSAIVRLQPRPFAEQAHLAQLERVVTAAFNQRRKTLRNALGRLLSATEIESAGVDPTVRAEQVSVLQFVTLSHLLPTL